MEKLSNGVLRNLAFFVFTLAACANAYITWYMLENAGAIPFGLSSQTIDLIQNASLIGGLAGGITALVVIRPAWAEIVLLILLVPLTIFAHYLFLMAIPDQVNLTYTIEDFSVHLFLLEAPMILTAWAAIGLMWASYFSNEHRRV